MKIQEVRVGDDASVAPIKVLVLDSRGAQAALSMTERTLQERTRDGTIPHLKIGRLVRYPVSWLEEWLASEKPAELASQFEMQEVAK